MWGMIDSLYLPSASINKHSDMEQQGRGEGCSDSGLGHGRQAVSAL